MKELLSNWLLMCFGIVLMFGGMLVASYGGTILMCSVIYVMNKIFKKDSENSNKSEQQKPQTTTIPSYPNITENLMNKTFTAGGTPGMAWKKDGEPVFDILHQVKFTAYAQTKKRFMGLVAADKSTTTKYHITDVIYKRCGFDNYRDYCYSYPGRLNKDSKHTLKKAGLSGSFIPSWIKKEDFDGVKVMGIDWYGSLTFDDYKEVIDHLLSEKLVVFAAPTVDEAIRAYERNESVVTFKYKDLWFCEDWKGDFYR